MNVHSPLLLLFYVYHDELMVESPGCLRKLSTPVTQHVGRFSGAACLCLLPTPESQRHHPESNVELSALPKIMLSHTIPV